MRLQQPLSGRTTRLAVRAQTVVPSQVIHPNQTVKVPNIALKEWAVAIGALRDGEATFLLRKGGIKEPVFRPPGKQFLLFPTSFHSNTDLLKPGVAERYSKELALEPRNEATLQLTTMVEVTGAWTSQDPAVLEALEDLHIWTPAFVEARLKWRGAQPLTILELRAYNLQPPLDLQVREEFFGCFSFVDLAAGLPDTEMLHQVASPAMPDGKFQLQAEELRKRLAAIQHTVLQLDD